MVCPREYIAALGAFFSLLLNVLYQVYPQVTCLIKCKITRVTFLAYYEACDTMGLHHKLRNEKWDLWTPLKHQTPPKIPWEEHLIDVRFCPDLGHL